MMNDIDFDGFAKLDKAHFLPECPGIYFVTSQSEVFYVGRSMNIRARFTSHHKLNEFKELEDPKVYWININVPEQELDFIERGHISAFSPCLNTLPYPLPANGNGRVIQGKLYTSQELQKYLDVSKQRISNIAARQGWKSPHPGLYWAQDVEPYLMGRNIDPIRLPVVSWEAPEGESDIDFLRQ